MYRNWEEDSLDIHPVLKLDQLTKRFTGVVAVNHVSLEILENEIHAIIGENGAGKSTLCKILTGIYTPDEGTIELFGKFVVFKHPSQSLKAGIGMVYQERNLVGFMTGAENICLGNEPVSKLLVNKKKIKEDAEAFCKRMGFKIPLDVPVENLGAGVQQLIEIMRSFYMDPKLLILDEPTASLGAAEVGPFLDEIIRIRKETGISIIFISHKIEEVFKIADRITVMRDGQKVLTVNASESCIDDCVAAMVRDSQLVPVVVKDLETSKLDKILEVEKLSYDGSQHDLRMTFHLGEVVGLYGLVGSGRTESMQAIYGIRPAEERNFVFAGETINKETPQTMIKKGMVMTPEKRADGEFFGLSLVDNICNLFLGKLSNRFGLLNFKEMNKLAVHVLKKNKVKHTSLSQNMSDLSGGNKQKIIIGRSIEVEKLKLLILDESTAGLDLGAKHGIYLQIRSLADNDHKSIIFISSELEELIATCDRIYVYFNGNVAKEFLRRDFVKQDILTAALKGNSDGHI
jgi:ABC-type sugar transport system ATPase subunit